MFACHISLYHQNFAIVGNKQFRVSAARRVQQHPAPSFILCLHMHELSTYIMYLAPLMLHKRRPGRQPEFSLYSAVHIRQNSLINEHLVMERDAISCRSNPRAWLHLLLLPQHKNVSQQSFSLGAVAKSSICGFGFLIIAPRMRNRCRVDISERLAS